LLPRVTASWRVAVAAALVFGGLVGAPAVLAAPFCPGNGPASVDPMFNALVQRVGPSVVGTAQTCANKLGALDMYTQETSNGVLSHGPDGSNSFQIWSAGGSDSRKWVLLVDGTLILPDGTRLGGQPTAPAAPAQPAVAPAGPAQPVPDQPSAKPASDQPPATTNADGAAAAPAADQATAAPAADQAAASQVAMPTATTGVALGRYGCFAQGVASLPQATRGSSITKEVYPDGTWRDTSYGAMTANNPKYAGLWNFDGATLTLTWGSDEQDEQDTFTPELAADGTPRLVQFGAAALPGFQSASNLTCYLITAF
jgi:hypothetical protein